VSYFAKQTFLRPREAAALLGISVPTLRRAVRDGRLPAPIYLSPRTPRFRKAQLLEWLGVTDDN
jgi:excisionase family DNA binding protein